MLCDMRSTDSSAASACVISGSNVRPSAVSSSRRRRREKSASPTRSSTCRSKALAAGWDMPTAAAEAVTEPVRATAQIKAISLFFISIFI
ncbi:hypothetical protein D3C86_1908900 [compost metagenome]